MLVSSIVGWCCDAVVCMMSPPMKPPMTTPTETSSSSANRKNLAHRRELQQTLAPHPEGLAELGRA